MQNANPAHVKTVSAHAGWGTQALETQAVGDRSCSVPRQRSHRCVKAAEKQYLAVQRDLPGVERVREGLTYRGVRRSPAGGVQEVDLAVLVVPGGAAVDAAAHRRQRPVVRLRERRQLLGARLGPDQQHPALTRRRPHCWLQVFPPLAETRRPVWGTSSAQDAREDRRTL